MEKIKMYLFRRNDRVHHIKQNSMIAVRDFQNQRWRLITVFEDLSGFWPYQSKLKQYPLQLFHFFISLVAVSVVANKLREYVGVDTNMIIECSLLIFAYVGLLVKLILASTSQRSRRKAYERITKHFETISDPEEVAVLNKGAEGGFKYTVFFICIMNLALVIYNSVPVLRSFYLYLFNDCELRIQQPVPMNFGFDHSKHWYIIVLVFMTWMCSAFLIEFAHDLSFMLQVRHVAGLFKIVGIRLRKTSEFTAGFENKNMSVEASDQSYSLISSAFDLLSECFELVKLIEKSYTSTWFIILLLSTASFGAGIQLVSTKIHDPIETFRYTLAFMVILLHFWLVFSQGQLIIDSANSVSDACYQFKWYALPKKSWQQSLMIMMIRSSIPCQLTGAKLFPLSIESFGKMLKAGLSYYTVFRARCA